MRGKSIAIAGVIAVTTFLIVGIAVTALLESRIEFSLFVGLPAGFLGGVIAGAGTLYWFAKDEQTAHVIAGSLAWFLVGFVGSMGVLLVGLNGSMLTSSGIAAVVGIAASGLAYGRLATGRKRTDPQSS